MTTDKFIRRCELALSYDGLDETTKDFYKTALNLAKQPEKKQKGN